MRSLLAIAFERNRSGDGQASRIKIMYEASDDREDVTIIQRFLCDDARLLGAVKHRGVVYISAQADKGLMSKGADCAAQMRDSLSAIDAALAAAATNKAKLMEARIYLRSLTDAPTIDRVWTDWLGTSQRPMRSCAQAALEEAGALVQVSVVAAV